ncbi:MAG TPA: bifunctional alpha/beta hydrolase/OsmC family protein [Acetobacteraceae bacterium]|jgi:putative redox protein|nr:bifunctional alpha/beta hydrolase/OsmC family protein [Acetobacteraceae bacterium]
MPESMKVEFPGATGAMLAARLDLPAKPRAFALFAHCFTCGKDIFAASRIAEGLAARDIAVLRFDFTGIGSSEGEFANTNFSSNVGDLVAAADYLRQNHGPPSILIGHSLGGAAVLAAAPRVSDATAVVTIGAPASAAHVTHNFAANLTDMVVKGTAEVTLAGRTFTITQQFLDDLTGQNFLDDLAKMKKALLVCHAPQDEYVGIENATGIFTAARHPKSFLSLDTADHLLRKRSDGIYAADVIATWASRYLALGEQRPALPDGVVEVSETRGGHLVQRIRAGRHLLVADEPTAVGGEDAGPGPYEYLLAALGACTSMTMRLYAERKGIRADRFSIRLSHRRIYAEDCADCDTKDGNIGEITRDITIAGDVTEAERAKLMEIADRCPVHQTLTHEIKIRSGLVS